MATKNITPRDDGEGGIGTSVKNWLNGFFKNIYVATGIVDADENEVLKTESEASAVNEVTLKNAATGNAPEVKATGDDANITLTLKVKGTGACQILDDSDNVIITFENVASAVNYITTLSSATGDGVIAKAVGSDSNVDFIIKTKGDGKVQFLDGSDNEIAEFHTVASAVNFIKLLNSAAGNNLEIQAIGDDTNISIKLTPKGTGIVENQDGQIVSEAAAMTPDQIVKVNDDGVIEDATNTDTEVANAVTKSHDQNTDTGSDSDPYELTGKLKKSSQIGITAFSGGGQASAVQITDDIVEIATCAAGGDSVKLPAAVAGLMIYITNHGANSCDVFPGTDDAINETAANTAKALAADATMLCIAYDDTNWECLTLAR